VKRSCVFGERKGCHTDFGVGKVSYRYLKTSPSERGGKVSLSHFWKCSGRIWKGKNVQTKQGWLESFQAETGGQGMRSIMTGAVVSVP